MEQNSNDKFLGNALRLLLISEDAQLYPRLAANDVAAEQGFEAHNIIEAKNWLLNNSFTVMRRARELELADDARREAKNNEHVERL